MRAFALPVSACPFYTDVMRVRGKDQPDLPGLADGHFTGFGASTFRPPTDVPSGFAVRLRGSAKLRAVVRHFAPKSPGVYGMLGPKGHVVYIGKAKCLRSRLLSYFRDSSDPKAEKIIRHTATLLWENVPDEFCALLRELELIRRFRPRFNVLGQPGRQRYVYLCLGRGPAAHAYVTKEPSGKEIAAFGPFVGRSRSQEVVRRFNLEFRLRDCPNTIPMHFAEQGELFDADRAARCLRYELGTCLGPCGGFCTTGEYAAKVKAARAFLEGKDQSLLKALTAEMQAAAAEFRYEQAMAVRDRLTALQWLADKLLFLRTARATNSFVYPLTGTDDVRRWYFIHGGVVRGAVAEPTTPAAAEVAAARIADIFADPITATANLERCVDSVLIVTSWFRKRTGEKGVLLTRKAAEAVCQALRVAAC